MGKRNSRITENGPISKDSTNQSEIQCKTIFPPQLRPGGTPKSEDVNRHANIHSSSAPQSLDTSELSGEADSVNGSNFENVASLDIDQILELQPSEVSNDDVEKILSEIVYRSRFLISLCSSLKENLARPDPIYPRCAIEPNSYFDEWNRLRRGLGNHIERRLYDKCPTIEEVFFELQKLEYYLILEVPVYDKYDPKSVDYQYPDPRKAIELMLITTKYVTSLLDKISPPHIPAMTSDGYTDIESIFNSAIKHGSVNAKTDDNSNISDCVAPIEESLPLDHNSLKPNNPTMTSDDNAEIENSSNSAIEDGSVNAKTDDNSKTEESMSRTCILDKLNEQTMRRMEILSVLANSDAEMKKKAIEDKIKKNKDHNQKGDRTYKNDLKELVNKNLVSRGLGTKGYYFVRSEVRDAVKQYIIITRKKVK